MPTAATYFRGIARIRSTLIQLNKTGKTGDSHLFPARHRSFLLCLIVAMAFFVSLNNNAGCRSPLYGGGMIFSPRAGWRTHRGFCDVCDGLEGTTIHPFQARREFILTEKSRTHAKDACVRHPDNPQRMISPGRGDRESEPQCHESRKSFAPAGAPIVLEPVHTHGCAVG